MPEWFYSNKMAYLIASVLVILSITSLGEVYTLRDLLGAMAAGALLISALHKCKSEA